MTCVNIKLYLYKRMLFVKLVLMCGARVPPDNDALPPRLLLFLGLEQHLTDWDFEQVFGCARLGWHDHDYAPLIHEPPC